MTEVKNSRNMTLGVDEFRSQIKTRDRVRDLAEVYTHEREVSAMLNLVPEMFPCETDPDNTERTFLEPSCGSGNFLVEILRRKLVFVTTRRYGLGELYEHRILRCLTSIYGIDICEENVAKSRERMRRVIAMRIHDDANEPTVSGGFIDAVEVVLSTNIIRGDTLADANAIELIEYKPRCNGAFFREWSTLGAEWADLNPFADLIRRRDAAPVHYAELAVNPKPVTQSRLTRTHAGLDVQ